jgi:hypothetical protein
VTIGPPSSNIVSALDCRYLPQRPRLLHSPHAHTRRCGTARIRPACRKPSRWSPATRYPARTRTAKTPRRPRADGPRVSLSLDCGCGCGCARRGADEQSSTDGCTDTAFRQQRLKAWQYVLCVQRAHRDRTPTLTARRQAHLDPEDRPPAFLHCRHHIRSHRRALALRQLTGKPESESDA